MAQAGRFVLWLVLMHQAGTRLSADSASHTHCHTASHVRANRHLACRLLGAHKGKHCNVQQSTTGGALGGAACVVQCVLSRCAP
jgi:hypothetical protein